MNAVHFIQRQLGVCGWAPVHAEVAARLEPDTRPYWKDFHAFANSPEMLLARFPGTLLRRVRSSDGEFIVITRSLDSLEQRIAWVLGGNVVIVPDEALAQAKPPVLRAPAKLVPKKRDDTERLLAIARREPPEHNCHARREILAARTKLDEAGIEWRVA